MPCCAVITKLITCRVCCNYQSNVHCREGTTQKSTIQFSRSCHVHIICGDVCVVRRITMRGVGYVTYSVSCYFLTSSHLRMLLLLRFLLRFGLRLLLCLVAGKLGVRRACFPIYRVVPRVSQNVYSHHPFVTLEQTVALITTPQVMPPRSLSAIQFNTTCANVMPDAHVHTRTPTTRQQQL